LERDRLKALQRDSRELRQADEILRQASACLARTGPGRRLGPCSRSSAIIATYTGSSRSAGCCRSPPRRTAPTSRAAPAHPVDPGRELPGLRRAESLAAARPRRRRRRPLHSGQADARDGSARSCARKNKEDHGRRQGGALSARPGEPAVPGTTAERSASRVRRRALLCSRIIGRRRMMGRRLHQRRHVGWLRPRHLRDRRLCPPDRRPADVAKRRNRLRPRRPGASASCARTDRGRARPPPRPRRAGWIQVVVATPRWRRLRWRQL
jgi:hypothetical protein